MTPVKTILVPINPAGWPFIAMFAAIAVALGYYAEPLGWIGLVLTLWCVYFFRDPDRVTPTRPGLVIAPADGRICLIDEAAPPAELGMGDELRPRVCIFMNVFNVHVNRAPMDGTISKLAYRPGKFLNAELDKASEFNERQSVSMRTKSGHDIAFVQIAGLVARRILCQVKEGQELKAGERFGLIRFGSRVDVYMPKGTAPLVSVGQLTTAGETVIADLESSEPRREGAVR
ncbi:MAG: phosphatidylserine decarboxylase [Alphaproteobacteria bacterium]|nr:phosphatidylserine decarboxylase [Alphaproteobacteria bacterium]MBF0251950.1 phosphatidylserine decarboxylase [Alphaproteobacteria bacterium]